MEQNNELKENKEILKKGKSKKTVAISVACLILILILTLGICMLIQNTNKVKGPSISTPELARAMEYRQITKEEKVVDETNENVLFSAFFLRDITGDGYTEELAGTCKKIGSEDTLYMELNVQTEGHLENGKIEIQGKNFYLQTKLPEDDELKKSYIGDNVKTIEFKNIDNGTQKLITGVIRSGNYTITGQKASAIGSNKENYSVEDNKIIFTGTYVSAEGSVQIRKEIDLTVDWYGTTSARLNTTNQTNYDLQDRINEASGNISLNFSVNTQETSQELNISKNYVKGTVPQLSEMNPISVRLTSGTTDNLQFTYNNDTREFTIEKTAIASEETGEITTSIARDNTYNLEVIYPIEAYQALGEERVTIQVPVSTYYEGYNNKNEEFDNPYKSNIANATIIATFLEKIEVHEEPGKIPVYPTTLEVTVGKVVYDNNYYYSRRDIVSKEKPLKIYNGLSGEETEDTYIVRWNMFTGTDGATDGLVMKETKNDTPQVVDQFIKADGKQESMENVISNIGIAFAGADNVLQEDGWIRVYDEETGNLIEEFTKNNWNNYTSTNPYRYELPIKHIRIETSATNAEKSLTVYNVKEIDDEYITTHYTRQKFDEFKYIKSTLVGYLGGNFISLDTHQANYEAPYSIATISISNKTLSTQKTEENDIITIDAQYDTKVNQAGWLNGSFLVKLPEEILKLEINDVKVSNSNSDVKIVSYEVIEKEGCSFIKINTENKTPDRYTIKIDTNITPDPRKTTSTGIIELYATSESTTEYYYKSADKYDVNNNSNTQEMVNRQTASISLIAPSTLLTNQTVSQFDETGTEIISPQIANIKPVYANVENEEKTARIGVQIRSNYSNTISEVLILGKIPFAGNTYALSGKDLESEFTTTMKAPGIEIPEALKGKAKVYYSENPEATKDDLNTEGSDWKEGTDVGDNWDNIRTFLIDLGEDTVINQGEEYIFYYTIKIPSGIEVNKASYSHHGIWFSLDTKEGKYKTETEPNKVGFRIFEEYDLELNKFQARRENLVAGATYSVQEVLDDGTLGETKTGITDAEGKLTINGLYAERTYELKEIKTPNDYEKNEDVIRFIGHVDTSEGTLKVETSQGAIKGEIQTTKTEEGKYKATIQVEDEVKAKLKIVKKEKGEDKLLQGVKYKLTGEDLGESGKILITNESGEITVNGLLVGGDYKLEELRAEGYYIAKEPITFTILDEDGEYRVEVTSGEVSSNSVTVENYIPIATLTLEDEKIPRYNLEVLKIKRITETTLSTDELIGKAEANIADSEVSLLEGAKFKLYKGTKQIGEYVTEADGKITIEDLYQYKEGEEEEATYTLKEVLPPEGYTKAKDITFKVQMKDDKLELINVEGEEEQFTSDGTTVKLLVEDTPSFKLIKKDAETKAPIENVKFAIYNIGEGETPARNSKGEIIGKRELVYGKEFYTVTTDNNGEITADLPEGYYKAVEVVAPEKYDISKSTYYFGIGGSKEGKKEWQAEWTESLEGSCEYTFNKTVLTDDEGYIAVGTIKRKY